MSAPAHALPPGDAPTALPPNADPPDPEVLAVIRPKAGRRWRWAIGGLVPAALAGGIAFALHETPVAYTTAVVTRGALVQTVTAVGELAPIEQVDVGSDLSGKIVEVAVEANDPVVKGQLLARIDPVPYENAVTQARAQLDSAVAALAQAKVNATSARQDHARLGRLLEKGAATTVDVEDARLTQAGADAAVDAAAATVAQRRAALQKTEDDLKKTTITAPISGVVTRRLVEPGQTVVSAMSASSLFEVSSALNELKAEVGVDEADVGGVVAGQTATFTVSTWPDRSFTASVVTVDLAPEADADVVTYDAELRIDNADGVLRPGMTATAVIETGRTDNVILLPSAAMRFSPADTPVTTTPRVWTLDGDKPVPHDVTVVGTQGADAAVTGIEPGAVVITGAVVEPKPKGGM